jgi:hypothetical protein
LGPSSNGNNAAAATSGTSANGSEANGSGAAGAEGSIGDPNGESSTARLDRSENNYSLRGVYFRREWFGSTADCLTAASARRLPLELCQ